ncbi:MAG: hypothetical protein NVS3B26_04100 [Mycobacteriales bacterium]
MDTEQRLSTAAERRRHEALCISCPFCAGAVPVLARCIGGDVEPVLECRTCGWTRPARRADLIR